MNTNPFPEDSLSGQIKSLDEFDPNTPRIEVSIEAQKLLETIPMHKRVEYVTNSIEPELANERKQLEALFNNANKSTK